MTYFLAYRIAQNGATDNASFVYKLTTNFWGVQKPVVYPQEGLAGSECRHPKVDAQRLGIKGIALYNIVE